MNVRNIDIYTSLPNICTITIGIIALYCNWDLMICLGQNINTIHAQHVDIANCVNVNVIGIEGAVVKICLVNASVINDTKYNVINMTIEDGRNKADIFVCDYSDSRVIIIIINNE